MALIQKAIPFHQNLSLNTTDDNVTLSGPLFLAE